jgi:small-conductance mechanosensitive channel
MCLILLREVTMWEWLVTNGTWIFIAIVVGFILFYLLKRWVPRAIAKIVPKQWQEHLQGTQKLVTWIILAIGGLLLALAVAGVTASRFGVDVSPALGAVGKWFMEHGVPILVIILLGYLGYRVAKVVISRLITRYVEARGKGRHSKSWFDKRAQTLSGILTGAVGIVIVLIAIFTILSEIGINITALLASAGVVGIAVGFAAQSLVKDFIQGLLILLEDQYNKDDVVKIAGIGGLVEDVNLRRTVLRDLDGIVHSIPNSEITTSSNYTRDLSRVNLNIPVAYGEDLDHVIAVINRVGKELAEDEHFSTLIRTAPQVLRVDNFGDSAIEIKVLGDTRAMKQWEVTGELRKRIKKAFDDEGIEIPWPHVKLYFGQSQASGGPACEACANFNLPGSKFCSRCGAKLSP